MGRDAKRGDGRMWNNWNGGVGGGGGVGVLLKIYKKSFIKKNNAKSTFFKFWKYNTVIEFINKL